MRDKLNIKSVRIQNLRQYSDIWGEDCPPNELPDLIVFRYKDFQQAIEDSMLTSNQKRMFLEIRATLSPTLSDLMRNTGYKNGTAQSALRGLIKAGLVEKKGRIYVEKTT